MKNRLQWLAWLAVLLVAGRVSGEEPTPAPYEVMDQRALSAPDAVATSPATLAAYLCAPAQNDWQKARAIFRWITANIDYDIEAFLHRTKYAIEPGDVLLERKAVCSGYARLFKRLCEEAGLESKIVLGHCREYGDPDERLRAMYGWPIGHAWNVIKLGGQWYPLDATWGAGHIQNNREFVRDFDPHYFLTRPVEFIHTHFPEDPKWQLLPKPIEQAMYDRLVHVRSGFFRHGLKLVSHRLMDIHASGPLTVSLGAPLDVEIYGVLERNGTNLPMNRVFAQRRGSHYELQACFSEPGEYQLRIYSERKGDRVPTDRLQWALGYKVTVERAPANCPGYPDVYRTFRERNAHVSQPLAGTLAARRLTQFLMTVPGAENVYIQSGGQFQNLTRQGDQFTGQINPLPSELVVFAQFPHEEQAWGLLRYQVD